MQIIQFKEIKKFLRININVKNNKILWKLVFFKQIYIVFIIQAIYFF